MKRVFSLILLSLFILLSVSTGFAANADVSGRPLILTIKVEGMITPGTAAIIERGGTRSVCSKRFCIDSYP